MFEPKKDSMQTMGRLATGRGYSLFASDVESKREEITGRVSGARVLVIGGGGSIGSATVRALLPFCPAALHVVDISENNLVELVRDLHGSQLATLVRDFRALPVDFGSEVFHRFLVHEERYDIVLNFAALKHVRSEKDVYSVLQMVDTNIVKQSRLLKWLCEVEPPRMYFSVSSDKAAKPVNVMGATKRFAEHLMFLRLPGWAAGLCTASARFANVAFSDGSLLYGWLLRLAKRQPIPVPKGARRYFISLEEAGQICLLAAVVAGDRQIFVPKLRPENDLKELRAIAADFLASHHLRGREYSDEATAIGRVSLDQEGGDYPVLLTELDTSGEKTEEEFLAAGEVPIEVGLDHLCAVEYTPMPGEAIRAFVEFAERAIADPTLKLTKEDIVARLTAAMPEFHHAEAGRNLDERL